MKSTFERILQSELAKVSHGDAAMRNAVYERARRAIVRKALRPDGTSDNAEHQRLSAALEAAVAIVEAGYGEIDLSPLDRVAAAKSGVAGFLGLATAATAIASGIDFFSVVLNNTLGLSAMAVYMLAGIFCLGVTALLLRLPSFASFEPSLRHGFRASAAVASVGAIALAATMLSPEARERGLIAALVPGAADAQDALLVRIERSTRETAESMKTIEENVKTLKKETSDNPKKELQNRGYSWSKESFGQALHSQDMESIELF